MNPNGFGLSRKMALKTHMCTEPVAKGQNTRNWDCRSSVQKVVTVVNCSCLLLEYKSLVRFTPEKLSTL